ncbi:hypothetical protein QFC22_001232 [Naganishia vaughanmartiniae]|uniref:Uncharacterized protein n=1 Tax=Naganishia vaughanmartiniae TaxID=1424756 RepID=A0ACC2XGT7_9TREE|nr:hypothetical protein QFC22_001232 [Naganishia vaughanmartiniae]
MLARTSLRSVSRLSASARSTAAASAVARRAYSAVKPDADAAAPAVGEVVKKLSDLEEQVKELKDADTFSPSLASQSQLQYSQADYINLQRRTTLEKTSAKEFAIQSFASDLLGTIDILTTALKYVPQPIPTSETSASLENLFSGVKMTREGLLKTLEKHGVVQFDPKGEKFDPMRHEALFQVPMPDKEPGTVFDTQKTGFMLRSRTLRPAQVGVVQDMS